MTFSHVQIVQRAFNTPLMVDPAKAMAFLAGLGPRIAGRQIDVATLDTGGITPSSTHAGALRSTRSSLLGGEATEHGAGTVGRPYAVVNSVAVIEIVGTLVHRGAWIGQSSGLTSYEGIATQLAAALADPGIRAIALDVDSFGGEVAGAFDLADRIRAAREVKPVYAFVADHALSAGYALAAQAERIILSRTGAVGSIGVVAIHTDLSGALEQDGLRVTLIHAGAHKVDANPYQPLPASVRDRLNAELEGLRQLFARTVAEGRGRRLDTHQALATEAAVFRGDEAIFAGLADEVADPALGFRAFTAAPMGVSSQSRKDPRMTSRTEDDERVPPSPAHDPSSEAPAPGAPAREAAQAGEESQARSTAQPPPALSTDAIRAEAAEVAQVCAQASRLGVTIDAADAVACGVKPEALRAKVLAELAARGDAAGIMASAPPAPAARESPIVAAARKSARTGR